MLQKRLFLLIITVLPLFLCGQISDDFSDGDFTDNPTWIGDTHLFGISTHFELQLSGTGGGDAYLFLPYTYIYDELEWRFTIRLSFPPSGNNFARIYLLADRQDLKDSDLTGYFLQFGESGSADAIELYYQEGSNRTLLYRGEDGTIANSFHYDLKVNRSKFGEWQIYIDRQRKNVFLLDGEVQHFASINNAGIGVFCQYTSSNSNKFYFDNFYFGPPVLDTVKPYIISVDGEDDLMTVKVRFNENVHDETCLNVQNYTIKDIDIHPVVCQYDDGNYGQVILSFDRIFEENRKYILAIKDIMDFENNRMDDTVTDLLFYRIKRHDIVINEIMADPSPAVQLPPYEFVEIKNCCGHSVNLVGWKLKFGSTVRQLPDMLLPAEGFAVIIGEAALDDFLGVENVYLLSSMSISNTGQRITLLNEKDEVIHTVAFKDTWHSEKIKREGGWSLEMIDSRNPCGEASNWNSSIAEKGGTPSSQNSIQGDNPDYIPPEIERVTLENPVTIRIFFTESLLGNSQQYQKAFQIDRNLVIEAVQEVPPDNRSLRLTISEPLLPHLIYQLTVIDTLCDCVGLPVLKYSFIYFGVPQTVLPRDVIINEIMLDPIDGTNSCYIEIYNRSDKIIDLKDLKLGKGGEQIPEKAVTIMPEGYQFLPGNYFVVCNNKELTLAQYPVPHSDRLFQSDSMPNYSKNSGIIHLTDPSYTSIDRFAYDKQMHYAMLTSTSGVSLEKIHFDLETQQSDHWKSAASTAAFGTPGYLNSQYVELTEIEDIFAIQPEIFSPNQDGFDDFVIIKCRFKENENRITITIMDKNGNKIKTIADNNLVGTEADFSWDGLTDNGVLAPSDLYIVRFQYWNMNGNSHKKMKVLGLR